MCSSGDSTAKNAEQAQAAFTQTLQSSFQQAFANSQGILSGLTSKLTEAMNNPQGFSPAELQLMKSQASDTVTGQTQAAEKAASTYAASHGGADLGSGVQSQIAGTIAASGATEQAKESSNIDLANAEQQQQNYWRAIGGLSNVAQAENPTGFAGAANQGAGEVANLSQAVLASQQAGWQDVGSVISGVAGLGSAATGAFKDLGFAGAAAGGGK